MVPYLMQSTWTIRRQREQMGRIQGHFKRRYCALTLKRENQSLRLVRTEQNAQLPCPGQNVITKNDQFKSLPI